MPPTTPPAIAPECEDPPELAFDCGVFVAVLAALFALVGELLVPSLILVPVLVDIPVLVVVPALVLVTVLAPPVAVLFMLPLVVATTLGTTYVVAILAICLAATVSDVGWLQVMFPSASELQHSQALRV
jgi:hypothetical protein